MPDDIPLQVFSASSQPEGGAVVDRAAQLKSLMNELAMYLRTTAVIERTTKFPEHAVKRARRAGVRPSVSDGTSTYFLSIFPGGAIRVPDDQDWIAVGQRLARDLYKCVAPLIQETTRSILAFADCQPMTMAHFKSMEAALNRRQALQRLVQVERGGADRLFRVGSNGTSIFFTDEKAATQLQVDLNKVLEEYTRQSIATTRFAIWQHTKDDLANG